MENRSDVSPSYKIRRKLGYEYGSFGGVYCGPKDGQESGTANPAEPAMEIRFLNTPIHEMWPEMEQLRLLTGLRHPNVAFPLEFHSREPNKLQPRRFEIFMENCPGGNLLRLVDGGMCFTELVDYTRQIVKALQFLHESSIARIDLQPDSILLTNIHPSGLHLTAKVGDVGNLVTLRAGQSGTSNELEMSSRRYWSPEWKEKHESNVAVVNVGNKSDVWSLGMLVHDMAYSRHTCTKVIGGRTRRLHEGGGPSCFHAAGPNLERIVHSETCVLLKDLLSRCLVHSPDKRAHAAELAETELLMTGPTLADLVDSEKPLWKCDQGCRKGGPSNEFTRQVICPSSDEHLFHMGFLRGTETDALRTLIDQPLRVYTSPGHARLATIWQAVPMFGLQTVRYEWCSTDSLQWLEPSRHPRLKEVSYHDMNFQAPHEAFYGSAGRVVKLEGCGWQGDFLSGTGLSGLKVDELEIFPNNGDQRDAPLEDALQLDTMTIDGRTHKIDRFSCFEPRMKRLVWIHSALGMPAWGPSYVHALYLCELMLVEIAGLLLTTAQADLLKNLERFYVSASDPDALVIFETGSVKQWHKLKAFTVSLTYFENQDCGYLFLHPQELSDALSYMWLQEHLEANVAHVTSRIYGEAKRQACNRICLELEACAWHCVLRYHSLIG